jgi:hypothetical protein
VLQGTVLRVAAGVQEESGKKRYGDGVTYENRSNKFFIITKSLPSLHFHKTE